jgi:2-dehydro-3-deoxyphosphogluconate aldolase/(4S)-4-hydroxy-2-oxoglutarate aldolase
MILIERLQLLSILPVVVIEDEESANELANALVAGGLPCAEITLRSGAALAVIRRLAKRDDILVGAGTVLNVEQARAAVEAGAAFLVSPGISPDVVNWSLKHGIPLFPGIATPTEIQLAVQLGITVVKFFPAEAFGGVRTIKALGSVFRSVRFIPTGGICPENLAAYLSCPEVLACGGSWMVKPQWIKERRFDLIRQESQKAIEGRP